MKKLFFLVLIALANNCLGQGNVSIYGNVFYDISANTTSVPTSTEITITLYLQHGSNAPVALCTPYSYYYDQPNTSAGSGVQNYQIGSSDEGGSVYFSAQCGDKIYVEVDFNTGTSISVGTNSTSGWVTGLSSSVSSPGLPCGSSTSFNVSMTDDQTQTLIGSGGIVLPFTIGSGDDACNLWQQGFNGTEDDNYDYFTIPCPSIGGSGGGSICYGYGTQWCGPSGMASYLWSDGETTSCVNLNTSGTYGVTLTDGYGNTASASNTLTVNSPSSEGTTPINASNSCLTPACIDNPSTCSGSNSNNQELLFPVESTSGNHTYYFEFGIGSTNPLNTNPMTDLEIYQTSKATSGSLVSLSVYGPLTPGEYICATSNLPSVSQTSYGPDKWASLASGYYYLIVTVQNNNSSNNNLALIFEYDINNENPTILNNYCPSFNSCISPNCFTPITLDASLGYGVAKQSPAQITNIWYMINVVSPVTNFLIQSYNYSNPNLASFDLWAADLHDDACSFQMEGRQPINSYHLSSLSSQFTVAPAGQTVLPAGTYFLRFDLGGDNASEGFIVGYNLTSGNTEQCISSNCTPGCLDCIPSFLPEKHKKYVISAWVETGGASLTQMAYTTPQLIISFTGSSATPVTISLGSGANPSPSTSENGTSSPNPIIDGWQQLEGWFTVPCDNFSDINISLSCASGDCYFDDVRVFPYDGSMKSYVYDPVTLRLMAELDERNYATLYEYDEEGKLLRVKKETERGVMTIQESRNSSPKN